jgi:hypothetical protein
VAVVAGAATEAELEITSATEEWTGATTEEADSTAELTAEEAYAEGAA